MTIEYVLYRMNIIKALHTHGPIKITGGSDNLVFNNIFKINYDLVNQDKRKGKIHTWNHHAKYIGQFSTFKKAKDNGGFISKVHGVWFCLDNM